MHALFMLISPSVKAHLHLLSRLAFTLSDPEFKTLIVRQGNRDEILGSCQRISDRLRAAAKHDDRSTAAPRAAFIPSTTEVASHFNPTPKGGQR